MPIRPEALVGVPAHATFAPAFSTLEASRRAGWDVLAMVNEPSAAEFDYASSAGTLNSKRTAILVWCSEHHDASIVSASGALHGHVGSRGLNMVGGDDFDTVPLLASAAGTVASATPHSTPLVSRGLRKPVAVNHHGTPSVVPSSRWRTSVCSLIEATMGAMEPLLVRDEAGESKLGGDIAGLATLSVGFSAAPRRPRC